MSLREYLGLADAIREYTLRSDLPVDVFISLAEASLAPLLNHRYMEHTEYLRVAARSRGLDISGLDLLEVRDIRIAITDSSTGDEVEGTCQLQMGSMASAKNTFGMPETYLVLNDLLVFDPKPNEGMGVFFTFKQRLPTILTGEDTATNWLLNRFPHVYLYASLKEAFIYLENEKNVAQYDTLLQTAMNSVMQDNERTRVTGTTRIEVAPTW